MKKPGPALEILTRRLASAPEEILLPPLMKEKGQRKGMVDTAAVVSDLITDWGGAPLTLDQANEFDLEFSVENANYLKIVVTASYLFHDPCFLNPPPDVSSLLPFLKIRLRTLSSVVKAEDLIQDSQRREELARLCLWILDLIPEGENAHAAEDRLTTLDSVEREKIIQQTREAQERARKVREEIARRQMEEEMASKMSRE